MTSIRSLRRAIRSACSRLALLVGASAARAIPDGAVIATDIKPDMVRYLEERARREQLANLHAVQATPTSSGLAARSVDAILADQYIVEARTP